MKTVMKPLLSVSQSLTILICFLCMIGRADWVAPPFMLDPTVSPGPSPAAQWDSVQASNGSNLCLAVWAETWNIGIYGIRLDDSGTPLDTVAIPIAPMGFNDPTRARRYPQVTWLHDVFLVVWQEQVGTHYNLYGRRVAPDGSLPDVHPFPIETNAASARYPAVVAMGTNALAAWATYSGGYVIQAQRLAPDGRRLGDAFNVVSGLSFYYQPILCAGDFDRTTDSYLIAQVLDYDIWGRRVGIDGSLLDPATFPICTNSALQYAPALTQGAGPLGDEGWWATWTDTRPEADGEDIYGAYISANALVSDTATGRCVITRPNNQFTPAMAPHDPAPLLVWKSSESPSGIKVTTLDTNGTPFNALGDLTITNEVYAYTASRLAEDRHLIIHYKDSPMGDWLNSSATPLTHTTQAYVSIQGALEQFNDCASDSRQYWVSWIAYPDNAQRQGDVFAARVTTNGQVIDSPPITVYTNQTEQSTTRIAANTNCVLVTWIDESIDYEVWARLLDTTTGTPTGTSLRIGYSANYDYDQAVATDGTNFMVIWDNTGSDQIKGSVIGTDGSIGGVFTVGGWEVSEPALAYGAGYYIASWPDEESYGNEYLCIRRYHSDGSSPDAGPLNICGPYGGGYSAAIAYNPNTVRFLLVWDSSDDNELWCVQLDPATGLSVGTTGVIVSASSSLDFIDTCYNGTNWLVTWREKRDDAYKTYVARVDDSGTVLDTNGVCVMQNAICGRICAADPASGNALLTLAHNVLTYNGNHYSNRRLLGQCWRSGTNAPDANFSMSSVNVHPATCSVGFTPGSGQARNYLLDYTTDPATVPWTAITNTGLLDSGLELEFDFEPPIGTANGTFYRLRSEW